MTIHNDFELLVSFSVLVFQPGNEITMSRVISLILNFVWERDCPENNDITQTLHDDRIRINRHSAMHVRSKRHQSVGAEFEQKLHHVLLPGEKRNSIFLQFCCRISNTTPDFEKHTNLSIGTAIME